MNICSCNHPPTVMASRPIAQSASGRRHQEKAQAATAEIKATTAATHAAAAANHSAIPTSKQKPPQLQLRGPVIPKGNHTMHKRTAPQPRRALVIDGQMVTTDDATKPRRAK